MSDTKTKLGEVTSSHEQTGYHQSWYALGLSSEIDNAAVVGKDFLSNRVVMYRDGRGKAVVQSAYCRHLGADLSVGQVVNGQIRCAYHHWFYNAAGQCVHIPTGDRIPPEAKIFTYPSAEAWGLIWVFNGEKPLFELPRFPEAETTELIYKAWFDGSRPCEPWVSTSNAVDFQHLRSVHNLNVQGPNQIEIRPYHIEFGQIEPGGRYLQYGLITGSNTFTQCLRREGNEIFMLFTAHPISGGSKSYLVAAVRNTHPQTELEQQELHKQLKLVVEFMKNLQTEDSPIMNTIRFREGILVASDRYLSSFFEYVRKFPCADPARNFN